MIYTIEPIWGNIITVVIAAFIGYITNYLAIKMLFRPYKKHHIGKIRIPFTPGIIPKNRYRISEGIADMVANDIVKEEDLLQNAFKNLNFNGTIKDFISLKNLGEPISLAQDEMKDKIAKSIIEKYNKNDISESIVTNLILSIKPKLGFFGGMVDGFKEPIKEKIDDYVNINGEIYIKKYIDEEYENILNNDFSKITKNPLAKAFKPLLGDMIKSIDLKSAIKNGIDNMDIKEFEVMLLKIMKKELRAITFFGLILGGLIGIITIFL